jgi:hypothetical protein
VITKLYPEYWYPIFTFSTNYNRWDIGSPPKRYHSFLNYCDDTQINVI